MNREDKLQHIELLEELLEKGHNYDDFIVKQLCRQIAAKRTI